MINSDDINEDVNSLLDLLNLSKYKDFRPPKGYTVDAYRDIIKRKLQALMRAREDNLSNSTRIAPKQIAKEIKMGIRDEQKEHRSDPLRSRDIALDHLEEDPGYYTKIKKALGESKMPFSDFYNLVMALEQETLGLVEVIKIEGIDTKLAALIDSGNAAYNVLHGVDIEDLGHEVSFTTTGGIRISKPKVDEITIHVGAGYDEHRPVVEFTVEIGSKVYPDVRFSIGDRTENQHPVLIGADFLKQINALIDVSK